MYVQLFDHCGSMNLGDAVEIDWQDGKAYKGKIIDVVSTHIKVRYKGFTKKYDEWIDLALDGKKVKRPLDAPDTEYRINEVSSGQFAPLTDECAEPILPDASGSPKLRQSVSSPLPSGPGKSGGVEQEPGEPHGNGKDDGGSQNSNLVTNGGAPRSPSGHEKSCGVVRESDKNMEIQVPSGPNHVGGVVQNAENSSSRKRRNTLDEEVDCIRRDSFSKKQRRNSPQSVTMADSQIAVSSNSFADVAHQDRREVVQCLCKFCGVAVANNRIECQVCKGNFHSDVLCLGVRCEVVEVWMTDNGGAVSYNCTECRLGASVRESPDSHHGVLSQLICSVGEMAKMIRELKDAPSPQRVPIPRQLEMDRQNREGNQLSQGDVLHQLRELRERDKRADSVIFRGFGDLPIEEVSRKFASICDVLRLPVIPLIGLTKVGTTNLYRAKISNKELRRSLLLKAPELKNTEQFSQIFVNRDLTKQQRDEVMERRRQHRHNLDSADGARAVAGDTSGTVNSSQVSQTLSFSSLFAENTSRPSGNVATVRRQFENGLGRGANAPPLRSRGNVKRVGNVAQGRAMTADRSNQRDGGMEVDRPTRSDVRGGRGGIGRGRGGQRGGFSKGRSDSRVNYREIPHVNF